MQTGKNGRSTIIACLFLLLFGMPGAAQKAPFGIDVALNEQYPLQLRLRLHSLATTRVTVYKSSLPWGLRDSIILVAVKPNGEPLDQAPIAGDPSPERILMSPHDSVSGDIDLTKTFKGLDKAIKKSAIHLFWAYEPPKELGLPHWLGGWILLPQQKGQSGQHN